MINSCLMAHHSLDLNWLVSNKYYSRPNNDRSQIVAGLRRVSYWEQLLNIIFILTRGCKQFFSNTYTLSVYKLFSQRTYNFFMLIYRMSIKYENQRNRARKMNTNIGELTVSLIKRTTAAFHTIE